MTVAVFSGLLSSAMSFGLQGGTEIQHLASTLTPQTGTIWAGMPVLAVVLFGGFLVNAGWCLFLNVKNKTVGDYVKPGAPLAANLGLAVLAGAIWCSQFVSFKTGEPLMGATSYIGWAVLMAAQILFSQVLGIAQGEWRGTGGKTKCRLAVGLVLLAVSAFLAGYGPSLG